MIYLGLFSARILHYVHFINIPLEKNKLTALEVLSIEMFNNLKHSSRLVDSVTSDSFVDYNSDYDDESDNEQPSNHSAETTDGNSSSGSNCDGLNNTLRSNRDDYCGVRIFDRIDQIQRSSYFEIEINDNKQVIHKRTVCLLLT